MGKSSLDEKVMALGTLGRVGTSFFEAQKHPLFFTALFGGMGAFNALYNSFRGGSSSVAAILGSFGLAAGALSDAVRQGMLRYRLRHWREQDSEIAKVLDIDYFNEIIDIVREENGFKGPCRKIEAQGRPDGTGIFEGGYFTELTLQFSEGQQAKLLYKYQQKPSPGRGAQVSEHLRELGYFFVPRRYKPPQEYLTRLGTSTGGVRPGYVYRGEIYEYLDGDSLENLVLSGEATTFQPTMEVPQVARSVFKQLKEIYAEPHLDQERGFGFKFGWLIQHFLFQYKLLSKVIFSSSEAEKYYAAAKFGKDLGQACLAAGQEQRSLETLIHGDLHQGNVMVSKGQTFIIDWDNAQRGIPYQDFFHFAVISDYERYPEYVSHREEFLQWQSQHFPGIEASRIKLTEFETYLSLLLRYYGSVTQDKIRPEFTPNMLNSCTYLLQQSTAALHEYARLTSNETIEKSFQDYCTHHLSELEDLSSRPEASVAYAHHVNHHFRKLNKEEQARENYFQHLQKVEHLVVADERRRSIPVGNLVPFGVMSAGYLGLSAYAGKLDEFPVEGWAMLLSLPVLGYVLYRPEKVFLPVSHFMEKCISFMEKRKK